MSRTLSLTVPDRLGWLAVGTLAGVLSATLVAPALAPARAADDEDGAPVHTLSVSGSGSVFVKPDVASFSVGVTVQRDRARDAEVEAAEIMSAVVAALRAQGIAEDDIQTAQLALSPVYDWDFTPARLVGYEATNIVNVTVRDLPTTGAVIDAAVDAGATNVGSISFRLDDPTAVESQAREQAMTDARAKADTLARTGGVNITGVISISETSAPVPYPMPYAAADEEGSRAQTPVQGGTVELRVDVSVVYSIE
jgi:uncharacterized protein YggE